MADVRKGKHGALYDRMYWILFGAISKANTQANSATYGEIP
jgi:hypothetical protein